MSRTKCDMLLPSGQILICSRCARLGMRCVPEPRRSKSSAWARLGSNCRSLLLDRSPDAVAAVPTLGMPLGAAPAGMADDDLDVSNTFCGVLGISAVPVDSTVLEQLVYIVAELAHYNNHCGLMSFALNRAHQLKMSLSRILTSGSDSKPLITPLNFVAPPEVRELFDSDQPCYMRVVSKEDTWSLPNPAFARDVCSDPEVFETFAPTKLLKLCIESADERRSLLQMISHTLLTPLKRAEDGTACWVERCTDGQIHLRTTAGLTKSTLQRVRVRYVKSESAEGDCINFLCVLFSPSTMIGGQAGDSSSYCPATIQDQPHAVKRQRQELSVIAQPRVRTVQAEPVGPLVHSELTTPLNTFDYGMFAPLPFATQPGAGSSGIIPTYPGTPAPDPDMLLPQAEILLPGMIPGFFPPVPGAMMPTATAVMMLPAASAAAASAAMSSASAATSPGQSVPVSLMPVTDEDVLSMWESDWVQKGA